MYDPCQSREASVPGPVPMLLAPTEIFFVAVTHHGTIPVSLDIPPTLRIDSIKMILVHLVSGIDKYWPVFQHHALLAPFVPIQQVLLQ